MLVNPNPLRRTNDVSLGRRAFLRGLTGACAIAAFPGTWAQGGATTRTPGQADARLVVVFLRGAYDGLSALVPHGDPHYSAIRPTIAIAPPDGTGQTGLALDTTFALHPSLSPLLPLWKNGVLGVVPCAGSPDPTRSHFDAQHHWETGIPGKSSHTDGWMNTLAGLYAAPQQASGISAVSVGEANPLILAGATQVQRVPKGQAAVRQGVLGDARTRDAVMNLYAGDDALSRTFRAGADSRIQTASTLNADHAPGMESAQMQAANNGAGAAQGLLLDAQHLGALMRQNRQLRLGFLSAGGWDTHANQGNVTGALAGNLASLASALVQLRQDFSRPHDVVLVCSEFGRTCAENGTRGTDHGHGNALWIMGNRVNGGRWHGNWAGLAPTNLHEGRDLPVHHDFRAVMAQVLRANQGLGNAELDRLFPGFSWDPTMSSLMRS